MEQLSVLLQSVATLAWPLIVIIILFSFRDVIKAVLDSAKSRKFTVKLGGNELTMEEASKQQGQEISDLRQQIVAIQHKLDALAPAQRMEKTVPVDERTDKVKSILWVDDHPRNNATLIEDLSKMGIEIVTATSTADALAKVEAKRFDRIISDMGRTESGQYQRSAGLDLTRQIRAVDKKVPIIIYSSSRAAQTYRAEALAAGANEITSSPTVLYTALQLGPTLAA